MKSLKSKILALAGGLIAIMVALAMAWLTEYVQEIREANRVRQLTQLTPPVSELIHELQKERGRSAGFLGSKGAAELGEKLATQRRDTDSRAAAATDALGGFDASPFDAVFAERISVAVRDIAALSQARADVSSQSVSVGEMAKWYTGAIANLLRVIKQMEKETTQAKIESALVGYVGLLEAKERMGLERAMGNAGFASGEFKPAVYQRFLSLVGQQDAFLSAFEDHATPEQQAFFDETVRGAAVEAVDRMREIAKNAPFSGSVEGVTSADWFPAITAKINLMKQVEDRLTRDLVELSETTAGAAWTQLLTVLGLVVAASAIALAVTAVIGVDVARAMTAIRDAVEALAQGGDLEVPGKGRKDEIGGLARAMERLYQKSLEAARLRSALDGCSTMVMVANNRGEIVYYNAALDEMLRKHENEIRQDLPNFNTSGLIGAKFDFFHKDPDETRKRIDALNMPRDVRISVGGRRLELTLTPVVEPGGKRIGTVVEWVDRTEMLRLQDEMGAVIDAAGHGDFSKHINVNGVEGAIATLASGVNNLVEVVRGATDDFAAIMASMARGDFTKKIEKSYEGKFGELKTHANDTIGKIADIVSSIKLAAVAIDRSSSQIRDSATDLAQRTEATAASLQQTSASTTEITSTVKQTAERAQAANQLVGSTGEVAERGRNIAAESVEAINEVDNASEKVGDIIAVIDEIAFQTNLLALNASVEAARAGEAGKGFAVVASEVRTLAQRSSDAAANIRELIQNSNAQVKTGVELAHRVGQALEDIFGSVNEVTTIVDQISHAANEQAAGVAEISSAVSHMDEITQRNAAMVQETTSATQSLVQLAGQLAEAAAFFTVPESETLDRAA